MKNIYITLIISLIHFNLFSQILTKKDQIAATVLTLPEELQEGAMVWGYNESGSLVVLKTGTNDMVCLADDPNKEGYNAACYHRDLEDFMARGRELKAEGKSSGDITEIRETEAKNGQLKMPDHPTTLHVCYGPEGKYNSATGKMENTDLRYVVYIPWATSESTGLPIRPMVPGGPWIMNPGTHRAHIMITPPKTEK
ncbi:hypothetical protein [Reichenbachiella sp. MALMAid0571]|uniref:hypothetical protein n=1 Tax=Reichenbachiella sp. MALMAid0571 TaxID=3143939 RepID=UPI0032DFC08F